MYSHCTAVARVTPRSLRPEAAAAGGRMPPSMEWEPEALSLHELKYAREAALHVLSTHSTEDAVRIFTEGLKPVLGVRTNSMDSDDDDMFDPDASFLDEDDVSHQYGRTAEERDVATAPF